MDPPRQSETKSAGLCSKAIFATGDGGVVSSEPDSLSYVVTVMSQTLSVERNSAFLHNVSSYIARGLSTDESFNQCANDIFYSQTLSVRCWVPSRSCLREEAYHPFEEPKPSKGQVFLRNSQVSSLLAV